MKHPVVENRVRLTIWWLAWLFLAAGQSLLFYFAYGSFTLISIADSIISLLFFSAIGLSIWFPFRFFTSSKLKPLSLIINMVFIGAFSILLWVLMTRFLMTYAIADQESYKQYFNATFPYRIGSGVLIYALVILSYFLFESLNNLTEKKAREARLESLVKETELKLLRSQINPHFLFNSLNSISSLTITDPEKARLMVVKLSEFMRYSLSRKDDLPVPLRNELDNLRLYLDIEKVRFGERLETEEHIDEDCLETRIPVLLLQPLYENAVKHGVYESTDKVTIRTTAKKEGDFVMILISNNMPDNRPVTRGTGTGIRNVERRLELSYGKRSYVTYGIESGLYTVKIYIPGRASIKKT